MVQRYDQCNQCGGEYAPHDVMIKVDDGDYVEYSDYTDLKQQRDDLLAACKGFSTAWITPKKRSMYELKTDMDNAYKIAEAAIAKYKA